MTPEAAGADHGPLGILACAGTLPIEIATRTRAAGRNVHIVAIEGFAATGIEHFAHTWASLGQVGRMVTSLRRAGCRDLVIAGALRRPNLWRLRIDHGFIRSIGTVLRMTRGGDDSVLRLIVRYFEGEGFAVRGVDEVAPELLAPTGPMGRVVPDASAMRAIERAAALIGALGQYDVGQAVVAGPEAIVAVEGARGTDAMLDQLAAARAAGGAMQGPLVLVKQPKPGQELRIDLPAIGPRTVDLGAAAGLTGVAILSGQSLVLERAATIAGADRAGLFVTGYVRATREPAPPQATVRDVPWSLLGSRRPAARESRDIEIGRNVLDVLAAHDAGRAVVVAGEHVLALDAGLGIDVALAGVVRGSHWGLRVFKRRIGVLVVRATDVLGTDARTIAARVGAVEKAGLAGVAICESGDANSVDALVQACGSRSLFVVAAIGGWRGSVP